MRHRRRRRRFAPDLFVGIIEILNYFISSNRRIKQINSRVPGRRNRLINIKFNISPDFILQKRVFNRRKRKRPVSGPFFDRLKHINRLDKVPFSARHLLISRKPNIPVSNMSRLLNKLRRILLDAFEHDFHIIDNVITCNNDRLIKLIIIILRKKKSNVFRLVGWKSFFVDKNSRMKPKLLPLEHNRPITFLINFRRMPANFLNPPSGDCRFRIIFLKPNPDSCIKLIKIFIAKLSSLPICLRKL